MGFHWFNGCSYIRIIKHMASSTILIRVGIPVVHCLRRPSQISASTVSTSRLYCHRQMSVLLNSDKHSWRKVFAHPQRQWTATFHKSASLHLDESVRQRIDKCIGTAPVVVFMKGTQQQPMCGFSNKVKLVLDLHYVPFQDFNVLEDEQLRQGIKEYSDWPTIPQVYVNGKFVGGADILVQMHTDGEIAKFFDQEGIPSRFSEKFADQKKKGDVDENK